jgi:2-amino-4-ketopentanoate thiolase alpha subunit
LQVLSRAVTEKGEGMKKRVAAGSLVDIGRTVLKAGARAPRVPDDTAGVPLEMKVKGILCADGNIGEEVEIETPVGRRMKGTLLEACPAYTHCFGPPVPELALIGRELRALLESRGGSV